MLTLLLPLACPLQTKAKERVLAKELAQRMAV
jgi:hypothetical protein